MNRYKVIQIGITACVLVTLLLIIAAVSPSQTIALDNYPAVTLPNTEIRLIHSQIAQRDYKLFISLPADYAQTETNYPVIYLLDAQSSFGTVSEYMHRMSFYKELPEVIVVGIGYTVDSPDDIILLRNRDLTPTDPSGKGQFGWADRFLSFITDETIPLIEKNYRVDSHNRTLVGHSLGGLFAFYTLFTKPEIFQRYVASSPSLWWDARFMFDYEAKYSQAHTQLNTHLYISAGGLETDSNIPIAAEVPEFATQLTKHAYSGLQFSTTIFKDQTHASVMPMALVDGIKTVLGASE
jgi:predicted alpha/beta superfamily hydrolase